MPCLKTILNRFALDHIAFKTKHLRIVLRHGIRHDFLEIHLLLEPDNQTSEDCEEARSGYTESGPWPTATDDFRLL